MSFEDDFNKELDSIVAKYEETTKIGAIELHNTLVKATPVDTGNLRASWKLPEKIGKYKWEIVNTAEYASDINQGRRQIVTNKGNYKWVGSEQLPEGYEQHIKDFDKSFQKLLDRIK